MKESNFHFVEEADSNINQNKKKEEEAEGVFYMQRNIVIYVFVTSVPVREYGHPEVKATMEEELMKWKFLKHMKR